MGPDWYRSIGVDSNTNLDDFIPTENYCNTVVYTHKWYLKPKPKKKKDKQEKWIVKKLTFSKKQKKISYKDAATITIDIENSIILGKPIECDKDPIVREPNIKEKQPDNAKSAKCTCCKAKSENTPKKTKKLYDVDCEIDNKTYNKKVCVCAEKTKVQELYRRNKAMDSSAKESLASSVQNNTMDDLSCSLSDVSIQKHVKPDKRKIKPEKSKVQPSESFEALAAESGNATIKLQLMNDKDKNALTNSLAYPIVNAVREFVTQNGHQQEMYHEIKMVQNLVINHSQKLDTISDRLSFIEGTLKSCNQNNKSQKSKSKVSTLELLSEDISNENIEAPNERKKPSDIPIKLSPVISADEENESENLGGDSEVAGQVIPIKSNTQKAPTRFCWTGTARSNQL